MGTIKATAFTAALEPDVAIAVGRMSAAAVRSAPAALATCDVGESKDEAVTSERTALAASALGKSNALAVTTHIACELESALGLIKEAELNCARADVSDALVAERSAAAVMRAVAELAALAAGDR